MPSGVHIDVETSYVPDRDTTIVWQLLFVNGELIQETIVGWYHGEPDDESTKSFSHLTVMAQYMWD